MIFIKLALRVFFLIILTCGIYYFSSSTKDISILLQTTSIEVLVILLFSIGIWGIVWILKDKNNIPNFYKFTLTTLYILTFISIFISLLFPDQLEKLSFKNDITKLCKNSLEQADIDFNSSEIKTICNCIFSKVIDGLTEEEMNALKSGETDTSSFNGRVKNASIQCVQKLEPRRRFIK